MREKRDVSCIPTSVLQQQRAELLAALDEHLEGRAPDAQAEVERQALDVDAVGGQHLDVRVVQKGNPVQVDHPQVGRVGLDLADVDHLVDVLLRLRRQLEGTWCAGDTKRGLVWFTEHGDELTPPRTILSLLSAPGMLQ